MKHREVIELSKKLAKVKDLTGLTVNYAIKKNQNKLKEQITILSKMEEEIVDIVSEYNKERNELFKVHGKNVGNEYVIEKEKQDDFKLLIEGLNEKFKETIEKYEFELKKYFKFLDETENEFQIYTVKKSDIPENITTEQMDLIFDLIKEE